MSFGQLKSNLDCPHMPRLHRAFLTDDAVLVSGGAKRANDR